MTNDNGDSGIDFDSDGIKDILLKNPTDHVGHAEVVNALYGKNIAYNDQNGWLYYNGKYWTTVAAEEVVDRFVVSVLRARGNIFVKADNEKGAKACICSNGTVRGVKERLKSLGGIYVPHEDFDKDIDYLNCRNGVVNLKTGEITDDARGRLFMSFVDTDYIPSAISFEWEVMLQSFELDKEVVNFLKVFFGYAATGRVNEEIFLHIKGESGCGKGTMLGAIFGLLGESIARPVGISLFSTARGDDSKGFEMAMLVTARVIQVSENNKSLQIDDALLKRLTGRNKIPAAKKGKDHFNFAPMFKTIFETNFFLNMDGSDEALRRRLRIVVMRKSFRDNPDKLLKDRLDSQENREGILAWLVDGAKEYYKNGIPFPTTIKNDCDRVLGDMDKVQLFLDDGYTVYKDAEGRDKCALLAKDVYGAYTTWARENGFVHTGSGRFYQDLCEKGIEKVRTTKNQISGNWLIGIAHKSAVQP